MLLQHDLVSTLKGGYVRLNADDCERVARCGSSSQHLAYWVGRKFLNLG